MTEDRLLRPKEAAIRVGFSEGHLANLRSYGSGPEYIKTGPRSVRYPESELAKWLEARRRLGVHIPARAAASASAEV